MGNMTDKERVNKLLKSLTTFLTKVDRITASEEYKHVWVLAHNHGFPYTGENCMTERKRLDRTIKEVKRKPRK